MEWLNVQSRGKLFARRPGYSLQEKSKLTVLRPWDLLNEHFVLLEHLAADFAEILENFRTAWHLFFFSFPAVGYIYSHSNIRKISRSLHNWFKYDWNV